MQKAPVISRGLFMPRDHWCLRWCRQPV